MAKEPGLPASRDIAVRRVALALSLCVVGVGAGAAIGYMTVGAGLGAGDKEASFAELSANPDALSTGRGGGITPCPGCADSYGVGARMRASRGERMDDSFRELGAVDIETAAPAEPRDDYRYGGGFPDPPANSREPIEIVEYPATQNDAAPPPPPSDGETGTSE